MIESDNLWRPVKLKSKTLLSAIYQIADRIQDMEDEIINLRVENEKLKNEAFKRTSDDLQNSFKMMGQTFLACIDVPEDLSSIGTVGATLIARIRDMQTIDEVKEFINKIAKQPVTKKEPKKDVKNSNSRHSSKRVQDRQSN